MKSGDGLLIAIARDKLQELREDQDLLVISDIEGTEYRKNKTIHALVIITAVVLVAALGILPIAVTSLIGCLLMVATGCLKPQEAYNSIQWKVIFLLAGVLSMGVALEKTGAASLLATFMIDTVGQYGNHLLLGAFFLITLVLTNFMSNNATAALLAPIAIMAAHSLDISAKPFLMAVTYASSLSLMTPVGYQTNAMIYGPGNYRFYDYFKVGAPLDLLFLLLGIWLIPLIFPF
jgi:di/tricarboxylate transporter